MSEVNWDGRLEKLANSILREIPPALIMKYLEKVVGKVVIISDDTPALHCPGCPGCHQEEGTEDTVPCIGVDLS